MNKSTTHQCKLSLNRNTHKTRLGGDGWAWPEASRELDQVPPEHPLIQFAETSHSNPLGDRKPTTYIWGSGQEGAMEPVRRYGKVTP